VARFAKTSEIAVDPAHLFEWHARPGALQRLLPPWDDVRVLAGGEGGLAPGREVVLGMRRAGVPLRWRARHTELSDASFVDEQVSGPFARWLHTHRVATRSAGGAVLTDEIDYEVPFGALGELVGGRWVERELSRMFAFRHDRTRGDVTRHQRHADLGRLRIVLSGASGLLGTALAAFLATGGHEVRRLVRGAARGAGEISWDPARGEIDARALADTDAFIHLSGENVGDGRWTTERKQRILESRTRSTELLSRAIAKLERKPRAMLSASAVGVYGDRADEILDEESHLGDDFLAGVCRAWERATAPASDAGVRVVHLRFGVVLTPKGGALAKLLPLFKAGLGGRVGGGKQYLSWIGLSDAVYAAHFALATEALAGPVNVVAPEPVTNAELTATLARVLGRPAWMHVPRAAIELALGEMGRETVLASQRALPRKLVGAGFVHEHSTLEEALRFELGRTTERAT
jgi:uncharacterized protein (TIGR01777 family)